MSALDGLLHILNFFAPALGVGLMTTVGAKVFWRQALKSVPWLRLAVSSCLACGFALLAGLVLFGSDGKMASYGLMLLACTLSLGWFGFRSAAR